MEIREYTVYRQDEILPLYAGAGWIRYVERAGELEKAYAASLCTLAAYEGGKLVGIVRAVGDGLTIVFIQDLIVLPECRRRGLGARLLSAVAERYSAVPQLELLTDDTEQTKSFYRAAGFVPAEEKGCVAFVRM